MSTYSKALPAIYDRVHGLISKFHPNLKSAEVKIDVIFAFATLDDKDEPRGPAIMHNGYPALGLCKILSIKDRVMDRGDAEIILDGDAFRGMTSDEQDALIDHELHHLEVCSSREGLVTVDDIGRPKLKMRKHSRQFGWFDTIAQRWGVNSIEVKQARELMAEAGQVYFQESFSFAQS